MTIKFYYLLSFCILGYQGQVSFIMSHSPVFQHYIRCITCLCSTITFHNFKPKMYKPECCEILNIAHRRIQATCPSNIYVIPLTRATSNLKNRNKMPKGVKRMKKEEEKRRGVGGGNQHRKNSQACFRNKHQTTCQISPLLFDKDCSGLCTCSPLVHCSQWTIW